MLMVVPYFVSRILYFSGKETTMKSYTPSLVQKQRKRPKFWDILRGKPFDTGYYMEEGVTPYYEEMYTAAKKDGITLTPYSAYRSYRSIYRTN